MIVNGERGRRDGGEIGSATAAAVTGVIHHPDFDGPGSPAQGGVGGDLFGTGGVAGEFNGVGFWLGRKCAGGAIDPDFDISIGGGGDEDLFRGYCVQRTLGGEEDEFVGTSAKEHQESVAAQEDEEDLAAAQSGIPSHQRTPESFRWARIVGIGLGTTGTTKPDQPRAFAAAIFSGRSSKKTTRSADTPSSFSTCA